MGYVMEKGITEKVDKEGEHVFLANFEARITKETRYEDGKTTVTVLEIMANQKEKKFAPIEVNAEKFASMAWVLPMLGVSAVISPGQSNKEELRAAIQIHSKPLIETIHTHTGYAIKRGQEIFLHAEGAITKNGNTKKDRVLLPVELRNFILGTDDQEKEHIIDTLAFQNIAPPEIYWSLLAATIAPLHGPVDFAVHLTGRTGTFKSEITSIFQSHFGSKMDARNLPGSWSSTANALEAQTYKAKNCLFTIDDYCPCGTTWQIKALGQKADQILRGQGNQAGRARLTDMSSLQTTMFPRGCIVSTGEDIPEGHSIRARMLILEIEPEMISPTILTDTQNIREGFQYMTGNYIRQILEERKAVFDKIEAETKRLRTEFVNIGHTRTPTTIGRMIASIHHFLDYAANKGAITKEMKERLKKTSQEAIIEVGKKQERYLEEADPTKAFCEAIRMIIGSHIAHLRTRDGGIPLGAEKLGWTREESTGDIPTYKSHGQLLGWIDWDADELYIDPAISYPMIRKHAQGQITISKITLIKRLKDAGLLSRVDSNRQRNTVRVVCQSSPKQVLSMNLSQVLEIVERPNNA